MLKVSSVLENVFQKPSFAIQAPGTISVRWPKTLVLLPAQGCLRGEEETTSLSLYMKRPLSLSNSGIRRVKNPTFIVYQQKREHGAGRCDHAHRHQGGEVHEEEALWKYFQMWQGSAKKIQLHSLYSLNNLQYSCEFLNSRLEILVRLCISILLS